MSLITPYIVFFVVLFGTIESIAGLYCYTCISVNGGNDNCENLKHVPSLLCQGLSTQELGLNISKGIFHSMSRITQEEKSQGNSSLQETMSRMNCLAKGTYASYKPSYVCSKGTIVTMENGRSKTTFIRGCDDLNLLFCLCDYLKPNIEEFLLSTCKSDNCNSSGRIEIGAISLISSLLVLFWSKL